MDEGMTDFQFTAIIKMVLEILDRCKDLDEAKTAIRALLEKDSKN